MLRKVNETIKKNNMLKAGDKVVCALSGGADSMALLCALYEIKNDLKIEVYAAHLNHMIRGEAADGDEKFVTEFCAQMGVRLFVQKTDIPAMAKKEAMSEEECGRRERYRFFESVCRQLGGGIVATGHHMNDNAETVLFNLFRGTGGKGLGGIPYKRDNIIRPLKDVSKKEIEKFLTERNILWCEDATNSETDYARNRIRLIILKEIEKYFPMAAEKINSAAESVKCDNEYMDIVAEKSDAFEKGIIYADRFELLHEAIRRRVIVRALKSWGVNNIDREKILAVYDVVTGETGRGRDIGGARIEKSYNRIFKSEEKNTLKNPWYEIKNGESAQTEVYGGIWRIKTVDKIPQMRDNKIIILLDADKLHGGLSIRSRHEGDYMYPKGLGGKKKLKKFFIDLKIPLYMRDRISVLAVDNEVLFVPYVCKTGNYLPDENTRRYLVAEYEGKNFAFAEREDNNDKQDN